MTQLIIGMILVLLSVVAFVLSRVFRKLTQENEIHGRSNRDVPPPGMFKLAGVVALVIGAVALLTSFFTVVEAGHRGVVVLFGNVQQRTLSEGFHLVNPMASVTQMSARVEKDEEKQIAETSDTQSVTVSVITNWRPRGDALATLYKDYGMQYATKIIPPAVREAVKAEVARYKVTELISKRPDIHQNVQVSINTWLNKYNLEVLEIAIGDIDFSDKYDAAIEGKQVQEQEALKKKYELDRTITEAQMAAAQAKGIADSRIAQANGEAESVKLAAQAEAEALRIRGEAQADFNRRVSESLSPLLIQNEYLKRWNGALPVYSMGGNTTPMLLLPPVPEKK